jgi:hypothetical protein
MRRWGLIRDIRTWKMESRIEHRNNKALSDHREKPMNAIFPKFVIER